MHNSSSKRIAKVAKYMDTDESSIKTFSSQLSVYKQKISHGEFALPTLKKQIENITEGLPLWREQVRILELSLTSHRKEYARHFRLITLLKEKEKVLDKIGKLEKVK